LHKLKKVSCDLAPLIKLLNFAPFLGANVLPELYVVLIRLLSALSSDYGVNEAAKVINVFVFCLANRGFRISKGARLCVNLIINLCNDFLRDLKLDVRSALEENIAA
jgi:hypothetical protein